MLFTLLARGAQGSAVICFTKSSSRMVSPSIPEDLCFPTLTHAGIIQTFLNFTPGMCSDSAWSILISSEGLQCTQSSPVYHSDPISHSNSSLLSSSSGGLLAFPSASPASTPSLHMVLLPPGISLPRFYLVDSYFSFSSALGHLFLRNAILLSHMKNRPA